MSHRFTSGATVTSYAPEVSSFIFVAVETQTAVSRETAVGESPAEFIAETSLPAIVAERRFSSRSASVSQAVFDSSAFFGFQSVMSRKVSIEKSVKLSRVALPQETSADMSSIIIAVIAVFVLILFLSV